MSNVYVESKDTFVFIDLQDASLCQIATATVERLGGRAFTAAEVSHDRSLCSTNCLVGRVMDRVGLAKLTSRCESSSFTAPILGLLELDLLAASTVTKIVAHGWKFLCPSSDMASLESALESLIAEGDFRRTQRSQIEGLIALRSTLSDTEEEVLQLVVKGMLNKQIANRLDVSIRTIEQRRRNVFQKMNVVNAIELARNLGEVNALTRIDRSHQMQPSYPVLAASSASQSFGDLSSRV